MRRVRVAQVSPYSLTLPGGVQGQVLGLARSLRSAGHDVRVLAPCDGPPPDPGVTCLGNSMPTATNGSFAPLAPDLSCALRTIRVLRDEEFDVVHLHEPFAPGPTMTALLFTETPVVGTFHRAGSSRAYQLGRPLAARLSRRMVVRCAVSADAATFAEATLGGDYELMWNGIEIAPFADADPWPTDGPTIFFVGRHEHRKGLEVLVEAMDRMPADVRLWVAGSGPLTGELQHRTAGDRRVEWLGRVSDHERASRMRGADVFCAPSLHGESFGIVLLEAMAAGTPIVASDLPGYRNVARADLDALLVAPGDDAALAKELSRVLHDRRLADELVETGRQRAALFSMDRLAEYYVERYEALAAGRPAGRRASHGG